MVNVLHTIRSLDPTYGGPSRTVPALCDALKGQGITGRVHAWDEPDWPDEEPDIIHDNGIWLPTNHRTAGIARRHGIPRVVSVHGMLQPWALQQKKMKKRLAWLIYQRNDLLDAAAIHVTSAMEAESVRELVPGVPLIIVRHGVNIPSVLPKAMRKGPRKVLFLSRIHPVKGVGMLLRAWMGLDPVGWELVIAGPEEDGHKKELQERHLSAMSAGSVRFVGEVSDREKWELLRSADLFVLPSYSENFGLVVAEALAAGLPVITTKGAPWNDLNLYGCGWWTEISALAVKNAVEEALSLSDEQRAAMGMRGRALVQRHYSWSAVAEEMAAAYRWLTLGGPSPGCVGH